MSNGKTYYNTSGEEVDENGLPIASSEDQEKTNLELLDAHSDRRQADRETPVLPPDPVTKKGWSDIFMEKIFGVDDSNRTSTVGNEAGMIAGEQTYVGPSQDSKDFTKGQIDFSTTNMADGPQSIANTGASSTTGGARYNLTTPKEIDTSFIKDAVMSEFKLDTPADAIEEKASNINKSEEGIKQIDKGTTGSRSRMGLFGNYGKNVEITKTLDPSGKVTRRKFVDGELVKTGDKSMKTFRQARREKNIGKIQDKVTGVFEKSKENRTKRQKARSSKGNNKFTGGLF